MANDKSTSTATVTVGCKLPHGFHLALHNDQGQEIARHTVAGANASEIVGGHGITPGVPKDFWDEWLRRNADRPMVKNGLIFANESAAKAVGEAQESKENKTGLEPIDPERPGAGVEKSDGKA